MTDGIVVDHKENHIRYAVSQRNFNDEIHEYVRDLAPEETVLSYRPRPREALGGEGTPAPTQGAAGDAAETEATGPEDTGEELFSLDQTEGSSSEDFDEEGR